MHACPPIWKVTFSVRGLVMSPRKLGARFLHKVLNLLPPKPICDTPLAMKAFYQKNIHPVKGTRKYHVS